MHFVFDLDGVICTPAKGIQFGIVEYVKNCKPIANVSEFMHWLKRNNHLIVIWCKRPNDLAVKLATEQWLELNEIPYDRLIFDRPDYPIFVNETPSREMDPFFAMYETISTVVSKVKRLLSPSRTRSTISTTAST